MLHEVVGVVGLEVALVAGQGLAQLVRDVDQLVSPQNLEKQPTIVKLVPKNQRLKGGFIAPKKCLRLFFSFF